MIIIRQLFEVILRKRAPSDVSYNVTAAVTACAAIAFGYFCIYSSFKEFSQPLLYAVIITCSHIIAYALLLKLQGKENRLVQTLTTLFGVSFILNGLAFSFLLTQVLALVALFFWGYAIVTAIRILKSSFSCPTYLAIVIYISVSLFSSTMLSIVAPSVTEETQQLIESMQKTIDEQSVKQESQS